MIDFFVIFFEFIDELKVKIDGLYLIDLLNISDLFIVFFDIFRVE